MGRAEQAPNFRRVEQQWTLFLFPHKFTPPGSGPTWVTRFKTEIVTDSYRWQTPPPNTSSKSLPWLDCHQYSGTQAAIFMTARIHNQTPIAYVRSLNPAAVDTLLLSSIKISFIPLIGVNWTDYSFVLSLCNRWEWVVVRPSDGGKVTVVIMRYNYNRE